MSTFQLITVVRIKCRLFCQGSSIQVSECRVGIPTEIGDVLYSKHDYNRDKVSSTTKVKKVLPHDKDSELTVIVGGS